jgi:methionyl-tRNA formyltransferase
VYIEISMAVHTMAIPVLASIPTATQAATASVVTEEDLEIGRMTSKKNSPVKTVQLRIEELHNVLHLLTDHEYQQKRADILECKERA